MSQRRNLPYHPTSSACTAYDRLCKKHGIIPTEADVEAIKSVVGSVKPRFEPSMLFFLRRSVVRFEEGSLLIGWTHDTEMQAGQEVWFIPTRFGKAALCSAPGRVDALCRGPRDSTCDEWHPIISDIVNPRTNRTRTMQYLYLRACVKILQATVPPPSIEDVRSAPIDSASTGSATLNSGDPHSRTFMSPPVVPVPTGRQSSSVVDLTGSDEEVIDKPKMAFTSTPVDHAQAPSTEVEERIQALRDKLDKKEVRDIQQLLEKQLPTWIRELAEDVLQKKMLRELDLVESFLL